MKSRARAVRAHAIRPRAVCSRAVGRRAIGSDVLAVVVAVVIGAFSAALASCKGGSTGGSEQAELRLTRSPSGRIAIELLHGPASIRAVQVELSVDGAFALEEPRPPEGLPLDTVRMEMRGANRAILFAADKRGVLLPRSGVIATFAAHASGGLAGGANVNIASAVVADKDGARVDVLLGPSIAVR